MGGCTKLMFKFRGFRASLDFSSNVQRDSLGGDATQHTISINGAYRTNRDEFYSNGSLSNRSTKQLVPSMVKLPPSQPNAATSKSIGDLTQPSGAPAAKDHLYHKIPQQLTKSTPEIYHDPRGGTTSDRGPTNIPRQSYALALEGSNKEQKNKKEQKKIEKQIIAEQKKREKLAAQEHAKQEKLRKEREKLQQAKQEKLKKEKERRAAQRQANEAKKKKGKERSKPPQTQNTENPLAHRPHSTNTLESSISRSSGPPPYSEAPKPEAVRNDKDTSGNVSYSTPVEKSVVSWDMISHHRQQVTRPTGHIQNTQKQKVMDLQYSVGKTPDANDNSEA